MTMSIVFASVSGAKGRMDLARPALRVRVSDLPEPSGRQLRGELLQRLKMEVLIRDHRYPNLRASFGRRTTGMPAAGAAWLAALPPGVLGDLFTPPPPVDLLPKLSPNSLFQVLMAASLEGSALALFAACAWELTLVLKLTYLDWSQCRLKFSVGRTGFLISGVLGLRWR